MAYEYDGLVGLYDGLVGEYDGDVGLVPSTGQWMRRATRIGGCKQHAGKTHEYDGLVGEYDGLVGLCSQIGSACVHVKLIESRRLYGMICGTQRFSEGRTSRWET